LQKFSVAGTRPISVLYNGVDHLRAASSDSDGADIRWPERFVFALASAAPNKNLQLINSLAARLRERGIATVLAGGSNRSVFANAQAFDTGVTALGRVSDGVIRTAFSKAMAFLFPSFHEGFGIPPLEAMAMGCPVIASNTSAMPEVLGDAALYCSPREIDVWEHAVARLAETPSLRESLVSKGYERARLFTWETSARTMLSLLEQYA
jgi:glycosyltransferase involved in cell wall biosynthesis